MSAKSESDRFARLANNELDTAIRIARLMSDPWLRCRALALVAWHTHEWKRFRKLIAESFDAASQIEDPNRAVTVAAWPLAALARRQVESTGAAKRYDREIRSILPRLMKTLGDDANSVSRADALLTLVHAVSPFKPAFRMELLALLIKECKNARNWKAQRQLEEAALVVAGDDLATAHKLIELLKESRKQRIIARIADHPEVLGPRAFFDLSGKSRI